MSEVKNYINFTNESPNDQGSIIPNNTLDFTRYSYNPVILADHDWKSRAIGMMRDIHLEGGSWKGLPDFHGLNEESKLAKAMYEKGYLVSASIGGEMILKSIEKTDPLSGKTIAEPYVNKDGYMEAEKFVVFEISFPTLPSNPTAVTDDALKKAVMEATDKCGTKIYAHAEEENVFSSLVTLSKQITDNQNLNQMTDEEKKAKKEAADKLAAENLAAEKAAEDAKKDKSNHVILEADSELPGFLKRLIEKKGLFATLFGIPKGAEADQPDSKPLTGKGDIQDQPKPTGMSAKKEAEEAVKKVKEAKKKFEDAEGEEKVRFKKEYEDACKDADAACKKAEAEEDAEEEAKKEAEAKSKKEADAKAEEEARKKTEVDADASKKKAEEDAKTKNAMSAKPIKQTRDELTKLGLAPDPDYRARVGAASQGRTFTQLRADAKDGERILGKIFNGRKDKDGDIADYAIILNAIMNDPKYRAVVEKLRFMPSTSMDHFTEQRNFVNANPMSKIGFGVDKMAARLNAGHTEGIDFTAGAMPSRKTTLTTTGNFASMDATAIEWLALILYKLFPSEDWKNEIPIFGAEQTGRNVGVIWTNIAANSPVYKGTTVPTNESVYSAPADTAVGMQLVPYWQAATLWTPLYMHQLRYDQMASGWIQNLAALNAIIGDDLLYTLTYGAYYASALHKRLTGGWPTAGASSPQTFNIPNSGSSFIFNSSFAGDLVKPGFNDILALEEFFNQQNYDLPHERPVLVVDSTMNRYIKSDPKTSSLLTRWINDEGADIVKISHTLLHERSRVAVYDPVLDIVQDYNTLSGVVAATAMSAGLAFIASQVAIGLGMIDVFMVQDPVYYGYKMSVDLRINARALRSDYTGLCMYTYATGQQTGS